MLSNYLKRKKTVNLRHQKSKQVQPLSAKYQRRLKILKDKIEKQERRPSLYDALAAHSLPQEQFQLLRRTASLGQVETTKQKLKRALNEERIGLTPNTDTPLVKEVQLKDPNTKPPEIQNSGWSLPVYTKTLADKKKRKKKKI